MKYAWRIVAIAWAGMWIASWFVPELESQRAAFLALAFITYHFAGHK